MTKIFTLTAALLGVIQVYAQPILQNNMPATGYSAALGMGTLASEGPAGASQTWDLSAVSLTNVGTLSFPTIASTPYAATYPNASYCSVLTPTTGPVYYSYYKSSATQMEAYGESISASTGFNYTPDTKIYFAFAMHYGDSLSDTWATAAYTGKVRRFYDGYGTLITPYHTYANVVRIKSIDTNYVGSSATSYVWYTTNPILQVASLDKNTGQLTVMDVTPTVINNIASTGLSVQLFPNPLTGNNVSLTTAGIDNYNNTFLSVYNLMGALVAHVAISQAHQNINLGDLASGFYIYRLQQNGAAMYTGKFSKQ